MSAAIDKPTSAGGPLAGIRVLDLSRVLAGPYCTMVLGDLGAEVIKIERPGRGDDTRHWGPPFDAGESAYFLSCNRNKKSVTVDFSRPEGADLIRQLAAHCDVVVENFLPGKLQQAGLDYAALSADKPGLVYCSITGFGQTGPRRMEPGYDILVQALSGVMSITGDPGGEPMKVGVAIADITAGLFASNAIMAALFARERQGQGDYIDIALFDSCLAWLANVGSSYLMTGELPKRYGNAHPSIVPYQAFAAADRHFIVAVGNDDQFRRLCSVLALDDIADDERFVSNARRVEHRSVLTDILAQRLRSKPADYWIKSLSEVGVPCGAINTLDEVFADSHVQARKMQISIDGIEQNTISLVGSPIKLSSMDSECSYTPPPALGQHTEAVLGEILGLNQRQLDDFRCAGVTSVRLLDDA